MSLTFKLFSLLALTFIATPLFGQGLIHDTLGSDESESATICGSYKFMEHIDGSSEGFIDHSNDFILNLKKVVHGQRHLKNNNIYRVPVVFHVLHNNEEENLSDEVLLNQLDILNSSFRRTHADTLDTRPEFLDYVGDAKIEFFLAETDPDGIATSGIERVNTDVEYFGGVLPYNNSQTEEIVSWVSDSLYNNLFSITRTDQGGIDPWDTERYLNIWIGDLRIFEPELNNFEELIFFGLATPPLNHYNWPADLVAPFIAYNQGVILHYVAVGDNNPNVFPFPYQVYNSSVNTGEMAVHEVGHYLGLRHIWGDGDCAMDDFIDDTPLANVSGQYNCNFSTNSCNDDIDGVDLPNMVENYMDYTSGACQNSFTLGQIDIMRIVLDDFRPDLADVIVSTNDLDVLTEEFSMNLFPNPVTSALQVAVISSAYSSDAEINIYDCLGRLVTKEHTLAIRNGKAHMTIDTDALKTGTYYLSLKTDNGSIKKLFMKI